MPTTQAIAIGLSEARRAGVNLGPPKKGRTSEATRRKAEADLEKGAQTRAARRAGGEAGFASLPFLPQELPESALSAAWLSRSQCAGGATKRNAVRNIF